MKLKPDGLYFAKYDDIWYLVTVETVNGIADNQNVLFNTPYMQDHVMADEIQEWGPRIEIASNGVRTDLIVPNGRSLDSKCGFQLN